MYQIRDISEDEIETYKKIWMQDQILTIPNFLEEKDANSLYDYLSNLEEKEWNVAICPAIHNDMLVYYNLPENKSFINEAIDNATQKYQNGVFSYYFYRKDNYEQDGIKFKDFARSDLTISLIERITGLELQDTIIIFASRYIAECFLSTHTDLGRGKVAFVYNLSKDWEKSDGGILIHPNKQVVPTFNSLAIFNVEGNGVNHQVTPVVSDCKKSRLAFTGWFK